jgi:hypothetical protein
MVRASGSSKLDRTKVRTLCTMASSTERTCSTLAPSEAISSISSKETLSSARLGHDARIGGVDAVDVGVDVAAVGAIAAAIATALVSEPPRPSVAMRLSVRCPGSRRPPRPGRCAKRSISSSPSISTMRAAPWALCRIGICQPCQERALTPIVLQRDGQQPGRHLLAGGDHGVVFAGVVQRRGLAAPSRRARWSCRPWPRPRPRPRGRRRPRA